MYKKKKPYSMFSLFRKHFPTEAVWLSHQANPGKLDNPENARVMSSTNNSLENMTIKKAQEAPQKHYEGHLLGHRKYYQCRRPLLLW